LNLGKKKTGIIICWDGVHHLLVAAADHSQGDRM
jgi:hypothetical protein